MSVHKSKRKVAYREPSTRLLDLQEMIMTDMGKMKSRDLKRISKDVNDALDEVIDLSYRYTQCYAAKGRSVDVLKRNMIIISLNRKIIELHKALLPFILSVPKISKPRFEKYTEILNGIIVLLANHFITDIGDTENMDELFDMILDFEEELKESCKLYMRNKRYDFAVCKPYLKPSFEKCDLVRRARNLQRYTGKRYDQMSLREQKMFGERLYKLSNDFLYYCHHANLIYPLCKEEASERFLYIERAKATLDEYDRQLLLCLSRIKIDDDIKNKWLDKYGMCITTLNGFSVYSHKRFKGLPSKSEISDFEAYRESEIKKAQAKRKAQLDKIHKEYIKILKEKEDKKE